MFKKITPISLSIVLLLYPLAIPRANSLNVPLIGEGPVNTQMLAAPIIAEGTNVQTASMPGIQKTNKPAARNTGGAVGVRNLNPPKGSGNNLGRSRNGRGLGAIRGETSRQPKPPTATDPNAVLPGGKGAYNAVMAQVLVGYETEAGQPLIVTSDRRTSAAQAIAMYNLFRMYGERYVIILYRRRGAVYEIHRAYKANRRRRGRALAAMTRVIQVQVARGVFISKHMLGRAFDVRSIGPNGARLDILRKVVKQAGGRVVVERNHYHVEV